MSCSRSQSRKEKCNPCSKSLSPSNLGELVREYKEKHDLHRTWDKKLSIPEAVFGYPYIPPFAPKLKDILEKEEWNRFEEDAIIHSHQRRPYLSQDLRKIAEHLAANWSRTLFEDFEDLYDYIRSILVDTPTNQKCLVKDPNALIIYDIALRLALRYGVWPPKYVYLNGSGPSKGVETLGLNKYIKKDKKRKTILRSDIIKHYPELGELDAAQLEDFLCIYHNVLNRYKRI